MRRPPLQSSRDGTEQAAKISFRGDVWPILKRRCRGCHTASDAKGGLKLDSVADMLKGGESGILFEKGKPDESLLVEMISGEQPEMPKMRPPLSAAKVNIIRGWIPGVTTEPTCGNWLSPISSRPVIIQREPLECAVPVLWCRLRIRATLSMMRAICGKCSQMSAPETLV